MSYNPRLIQQEPAPTSVNAARRTKYQGKLRPGRGETDFPPIVNSVLRGTRTAPRRNG